MKQGKQKQFRKKHRKHLKKQGKQKQFRKKHRKHLKHLKKQQAKSRKKNNRLQKVRKMLVQPYRMAGVKMKTETPVTTRTE